jgi:hypothetical protein
MRAESPVAQGLEKSLNPVVNDNPADQADPSPNGDSDSELTSALRDHIGQHALDAKHRQEQRGDGECRWSRRRTCETARKYRDAGHPKFWGPHHWHFRSTRWNVDSSR